jgi:transcriptional regulator with XRE-family HTH domain
VVPGWCTHCGHFLGSDTPRGDKIEPAALWRSRQIGELLASQQVPGKQAQRDDLISAITDIIAQMDGGQSATFARRIGVSKSTVHHWLKGAGTPKLDVSMKIAVQSGVSLPKLLSGDLSDWKPPEPNQQLTLNVLFPPKKLRAASRELDWVAIEKQLESFLLLPTPISVVEAAQRLQVEARQLYLRANRTTRMVGARWLAYSHRRQEESLAKALPYLESASRYLMSQGRAVTKREIMKHVPAEVLSTVPHLLHILKQVQAQINGFSGEYVDGLR